MIIIGVDFHPEFQQIACVDTESGEFEERRLQHREEAERFYRELAMRGVAVRVGMEASGHARWLERLLKELQVELWCGNKRAIIATARKLSVLLHRLWVRGEVYEPLRNRQRAIAAAA